jgi:hypothetical protein
MIDNLRVAKINEQATHEANVRLTKELFLAEAEIRRLHVALENIASTPKAIFELEDPPSPGLIASGLKDATRIAKKALS